MKRVLAALLPIFFCATPGYVFAGEFSVSPVRLDFSAMGRSQLLAVTNAGNAPARFLVRPAGWKLDETGSVELFEDDNLIVFPASFTLAPKATQNIRVGTDVRPGESEKTWRVVLEELPDPNAVIGGGATISVMSVISVPVFMAPLSVSKVAKLQWVSTEAKAIKVSLLNEGNAHVMVAGVAITAMQGEKIVQQHQIEGWYLLPGNKRVYAVNGDKSWCETGATRFEARATDRLGQLIASQTIEAREACR